VQNQLGLFETSKQNKNEAPHEKIKIKNSSPLAYKLRPTDWEQFKGQDHVLKRYRFLRTNNFPSMIFWGPPGTGKTTLANLLAQNADLELYKFNAVLGGVNDLKKLISRALEIQERFGKRSIVFVDEIHRFNKAQQDALLPYVESGAFIFIGATTENPRSCVNRALISRVQVIELKALNFDHLLEILKRAVTTFESKIEPKLLEYIANHSDGDARKAISSLESVVQNFGENIDFLEAKKLILEKARHYDKNKDRHYNVISAYIKSMRGSDPDAALLYLAIMLDGGEDPVFIARRLVIFASEDIGNADPQALTLAVATLTTVAQIGMPEARISLAQATTYLASTVKSNSAYKAIDAALAYVEENETIDTPDHLKNYPPKDTPPYKYPHSFAGNFIVQEYAHKGMPKFYKPSENGREKFLKDRLEGLWNNKNS